MENPNTPVKFLVVRFSSIGDIILTTPVVRGLKKQVEGAEVHFLTKPAFRSVVEANPYIDQVHLLPPRFPDLIQDLREMHFDYIIDLHHNLRTYRLKRRMRVMDFSFAKLNYEKWLMVKFKKNRLPDKHIVDRYLETVSLFDVQDDGQGLDYFIPENGHYEMENLPAGFRQGYYVFTVGAGHATKQMPEADSTGLLNTIGQPVILLGGKQDAARGNRIARGLHIPVLNLCGQTSLHASASLVKQARFVLAHDTGLMHIAAAFGKNIISLWGNTIPGFGMAPYRAGKHSRIMEVKGLRCRPCSKIGYKACPKKHFDCMKKIDKQATATHASFLWQQNK